MKAKLFSLLTGVALTSMLCAADGGGWVNLFDGQSLKGWVQKNGTAAYRVEGEAIVGKTTEGSPNSFLCTEKDYSEFELEFEVKVANELNSGVQLRSKTKEQATGKSKNDQPGRVYGPQVEIAVGGANGGNSGYIYGEATGLNWLTAKDKLKPHKFLKSGEWNKFRIVAKGPRIQTWINDQPVDDMTHEEIFKTHPTGFIGLQVHGIKKDTGPFEVSWRNIRIKELK